MPEISVPIWKKTLLSIKEAAALTGIGEQKLRQMCQEKDCNFVLYVGSKLRLKRIELEKYLSYSETI